MLCALVCVALAGGWNAKLLPIFDDGAPRDVHAVLRQNFRELLIAVGGACRLCGDKLDHIHTPDPVMIEIEMLKMRLDALEHKTED